MLQTLSLPQFKRVVLFLGLAVLAGGLLLFISLSYFNRHWADDWCYNADFRQKGFIETLRGYAYDTTYTPSRYSVTIFAGLLQTLDTVGTQWMTPLTILFWVAGLIWLFWNVARLAGLRPVPPLIGFFAALIVYFSIYLTPHLYQSLYWRTGLLTYTTPLVLTTWIFVLITRQGLRSRPSKWEMALAGLLSLLAGGCSEAAATVLVSSIAMYVGAALLYRRQPWAQKTLWIAVIALFFGLVAMGLLIFSPSTQIRRSRYGAPTPPLELPRLIFNYTYAFFVLAVKDYQHLLITFISALAGYTYPIMGERSFRFNQYVLLGAFIVVIAVLLVAASLAPSIYIEKGLPAPRTMIIPSFVAVLGFALGGWVAGSAFHEMLKSSGMQAAATVLLLLSLAFPAYTVAKASSWFTIYAQRAQAWDLREAVIENALQNNSPRVTVEAIDGLPVGGIRDFDPPGKTGYWITRCAGDYYGIKLDVVLP